MYTENGAKAFYQATLEGNKEARSSLYVRQMKSKSGGYEYKVETTKSPVLLRILHIFTGIYTKYFYGKEAIDLITKEKLIPDLIKKEEPPKEEPKKADPPPIVEESPKKVVILEPKKAEEPSTLDDDGFPKVNVSDLVDVVPRKLAPDFEEDLILDPELREFNIKEVGQEVQELAKKFAQRPPTPLEVRGQENFGNICYINSTLQCLETTYGIHDPKCAALIQKDLSLKEGESIKDLEERLLKSWVPLNNEEKILFKWTYLLLLQAKAKGTDAEIAQALKLHHKLFFVMTPILDFKRDIYGQKDAAEYFEYWLQILGDKSVSVSDVVTANINGQKVEKEPKIDTTTNLIRVPINKNHHKTLISRILESCHENIKPEDGKENPTDFVLPDNSVVKTSTYTKTTRYANPPEALHFHIVRFEKVIEDGAVKLNKNSTQLRMKDIAKPIDLTPIFGKQARYQLTSFSVHGGSLNEGHYVAYRRLEGQWYYCSDTTIHPVDKSEVPFEDAYLMSFRKI